MGKSRLLIAALAFAVAGPIAGSVRADEADARKAARELNALTGMDTVKGRLKEMLEEKGKGARLVAEIAALAKEKKVQLSYNAAYVLALTAGEDKDLSASEAFFRICMNAAAKLQSPQRLLESYGGLIDVLYEAKKYPEAANVCRELLELKTDDGKPRIVIRAFTNRFGEYDFIEDDAFDSAKRLRPGVHRLLIQAMAKQGKFDQALKLVDNLIKATDHWQERALRGWVLREAGQYADAAKVYEEVINRVQKDTDIDAEDRDQAEDRYRYILSNVYVDMRQIDKAAEQLQTLMKKKPDEPGYLNDLGYIWADHEMKLEEAEKMIRRALELDAKRRKDDPELKETENGAYLDSLGWVLFKQKRSKEALKELLKAVEDKAAQHIEIFDHLGDVYLSLGDRAKALDAWRQGLKFVGEGRRELERKEIVERKIEKHSK